MIDQIIQSYPVLAQVVIIVSCSVTIFSAVAALTATKKDDAIAAKIKSFLARFISIK